MKLPSFQDINKAKIKETFKNTVSTNHLKMLEEIIHPKLSIANQTALKEQFYRERYDSNQHTVQRKVIKSTNKERNIAIRKRSIKEGEKKNNADHSSLIHKL